MAGTPGTEIVFGIEIPPERIFILGDTPHDIACGKAIGAKTIAVATGSFRSEQLAAHGPDFVFEDFSDVEAVVRAIESGENVR